jgi:predicted Zn-dependent protease
VSGEKGFKWEFNVIESNQNNAFALPGGKVAVYSGIAKTAQNSHALAAVMGHEVAHATARHGGERMSQGVISQIGMTAASVGLRNNKNAGMIMGALGVGAQFGVMLPFSRKHESEADKIGMIYMAKAGYDPREAEGFWKRMNAAGGSKQPTFMSTHPGPSQRAAVLAKLAASPEIQQYYRASQVQPKIVF